MPAMSGAAGTYRSCAGRSRVRSVQDMTLHSTAIPSGSNRIDSRIIDVLSRWTGCPYVPAICVGGTAERAGDAAEV